MQNFKKLLATVAATALVATQAMTSFVQGASGLNDPEFDAALQWMYENGLTRYDNVDAFRPFDSIRRDEAAKFYVQFAAAAGLTLTESDFNCAFTDMAQATPDLVEYIESSCNLGLFKGANGVFMPAAPLTKAQSIAVLVRAIDGMKDETASPWWLNYFETARQMEITKETNVLSLDRDVTRYEVGLMLYRAAGGGYSMPGDDDITDDDDTGGLEDLLKGLLGDDDDDDAAADDDDDVADDDDEDNGGIDIGGDDVPSNVEGQLLEVSLNPETPTAKNIPGNVQNVEFLKFDLAAGDKDVVINELKFQRLDLGSKDDFSKIWISEDGIIISNSRTISSDDTVTVPTSLTVKAGTVRSLSLHASMNNAGASKINKFALVEVKTESGVSVEGLPVVGNSMTTVNYDVAKVTLNDKGTNSTVDVGSEQKVIGEFTLEETEGNSKKGVIIKSIRFRATGGVDLTSNLENIALYHNGSKVSTATIVDGKYVTFKLDSILIEDAKSKYFEIRADIISGDDGDQIQLSVRDHFDIYAVEEGTLISAAVDKGNALRTYTLNAGKLNISRDTSTPASNEYIANTKDVLAFVAKVDLDQPVTLNQFRLFLEASTFIKKTPTGTADDTINSLDNTIENVKLYVNDRVVDSTDRITDASNGARTEALVFADDYYLFDSSFELKDDDLIKVYVNIAQDAQPTTKVRFTINNTGTANGTSKSLREAEYITSGELVDQAKLTGVADSNTLTVVGSAEGTSINRNDGLANEVFLAGLRQGALMKFVVNAGNSSDLEIKKLNFDFGLGTQGTVFASTDLRNVKILKNGSQIGSTEDVTNNTVTIDSINDIIGKGKQATYELVADISTSATTDGFQVTLDASDSLFYDSNSNEITTLIDVAGDNSIVRANALLNVAVDGDTPDESIILANTNDVEVAKYKFTANDGVVNVKDMYFRNVSAGADDSRIVAYKLVVNGNVVDSRVPSNNTLRFNLGSTNKIIVPKNGNVTVSVRADLNRITSDTQTDKTIKLELTDLIAETDATSKALTQVENGGGTAIDNGDHYTTSALAALDIQSETMYIRKTQPTFAVQTIGTTKLVNGEQTLFKFTVTADSKADVEVAAINFNVVDSANRITGGTYKLFVNGTDRTADGAFTGTRFEFTAGKDTIVAAGSSRTFELKATLAGVVTNDYVSVKISEDTAKQAGTFAAVNGSANKNFVWSDNAGSPHTRNTADWFNGYKVKGLDTTTTTLTN